MPRKALFVAIGLLAFSGCASFSEQNAIEKSATDEGLNQETINQDTSEQPLSPAAPGQGPAMADSSGPAPVGSFSPDELYLLLTGEIAAQRGHYDVTLANYVEAARQSRDTGIIRRAILIASSLNSQSALTALTETWLDVAPDSLDAHRAAAVEALRDDDLEGALTHLETILRLGGDADFDSLAAMGAQLPEEQQAELLQLYTRLQERHPDNSEIRYSTALLQKLTGSPQQALETLQPLMDKEPEFQPALVLYGDLLYETGQEDEALRHLQTNSRRYPENRQLGTLYARMLVSEEELRGAQDEFARLVERFPTNDELRLSWALIAMENGELELAEDQLEYLINQGQKTPPAYFYLGQIAEKQGNTEGAITHYEQVVEGNHYFPALTRVTQLRAEAGDVESAVDHIRNLRQTHPDDSANLWLVEINLLQGQGLYDRALSTASKALAEHPENQNLLYARAMLQETVGQIGQAEADLKRMIELQPENPTALNALGYILTVHTDRLDEARGYIEEALAIDPDNPAILDSMGWVLFRQGNSAKALDYLRQAYDILPDPEIATHYGEVLWTVGEEAQARVIWERAEDEDPDHPLLQETLERLGVTDL